MKLFKRLFCKHDYEFLYNVYGDSINRCNCRSAYICEKCGKIKKDNRLNFNGIL